MATWMWTYEVMSGKKVSLKALKEKWASHVTKSHIRLATRDTILTPVGDTIASGFPLVRDLWHLYLDSTLKPVASQLPLRYILEGIGVIKVIIPVIAMNEQGNATVINFSIDKSTQHTATNLVFKARLMAANDSIDAISMTNYRLESNLPISYINTAEIDKEELDKNLSFIINSIKSGVNYPILNCKLKCPYKDVCY
jgi:hypothetical protein